MKRPMTVEELFRRICEILKGKTLLPELLDYSLASNCQEPVKTYEFSLLNRLSYGGNEGIYLNFWLECWDGQKKVSYPMGTFKTLREDAEAMHKMAGLLADFMIEESRYVNANLDLFTWEGVSVYPCDEKGEDMGWGYFCRNMEQAEERRKALSEKYPCVRVRDNVARKEKRYLQNGYGQAEEVSKDR